jgi:hypothetical protein
MSNKGRVLLLSAVLFVVKIRFGVLLCGIGLFRSSSRFKRREEAAVMSGIDELLLLLYSASK